MKKNFIILLAYIGFATTIPLSTVNATSRSRLSQKNEEEHVNVNSLKERYNLNNYDEETQKKIKKLAEETVELFSDDNKESKRKGYDIGRKYKQIKELIGINKNTKISTETMKKLVFSYLPSDYISKKLAKTITSQHNKEIKQRNKRNKKEPEEIKNTILNLAKTIYDANKSLQIYNNNQSFNKNYNKDEVKYKKNKLDAYIEQYKQERNNQNRQEIENREEIIKEAEKMYLEYSKKRFETLKNRIDELSKKSTRIIAKELIVKRVRIEFLKEILNKNLEEISIKEKKEIEKEIEELKKDVDLIFQEMAKKFKLKLNKIKEGVVDETQINQKNRIDLYYIPEEIKSKIEEKLPLLIKNKKEEGEYEISKIKNFHKEKLEKYYKNMFAEKNINFKEEDKKTGTEKTTAQRIKECFKRLSKYLKSLQSGSEELKKFLDIKTYEIKDKIAVRNKFKNLKKDISRIEKSITTDDKINSQIKEYLELYKEILKDIEKINSDEIKKPAIKDIKDKINKINKINEINKINQEEKKIITLLKKTEDLNLNNSLDHKENNLKKGVEKLEKIKRERDIKKIERGLETLDNFERKQEAKKRVIEFKENEERNIKKIKRGLETLEKIKEKREKEKKDNYEKTKKCETYNRKIYTPLERIKEEKISEQHSNGSYETPKTPKFYEGKSSPYSFKMSSNSIKEKTNRNNSRLTEIKKDKTSSFRNRSLELTIKKDDDLNEKEESKIRSKSRTAEKKEIISSRKKDEKTQKEKNHIDNKKSVYENYKNMKIFKQIKPEKKENENDNEKKVTSYRNRSSFESTNNKALEKKNNESFESTISKREGIKIIYQRRAKIESKPEEKIPTNNILNKSEKTHIVKINQNIKDNKNNKEENIKNKINTNYNHRYNKKNEQNISNTNNIIYKKPILEEIKNFTKETLYNNIDNRKYPELKQLIRKMQDELKNEKSDYKKIENSNINYIQSQDFFTKNSEKINIQADKYLKEIKENDNEKTEYMKKLICLIENIKKLNPIGILSYKNNSETRPSTLITSQNYTLNKNYTVNKSIYQNITKSYNDANNTAIYQTNLNINDTNKKYINSYICSPIPNKRKTEKIYTENLDTIKKGDEKYIYIKYKNTKPREEKQKIFLIQNLDGIHQRHEFNENNYRKNKYKTKITEIDQKTYLNSYNNKYENIIPKENYLRENKNNKPEENKGQQKSFLIKNPDSIRQRYKNNENNYSKNEYKKEPAEINPKTFLNNYNIEHNRNIQPKTNYFGENKNTKKEPIATTNRKIEKERETQTYVNKNINNNQIEKSKTNYHRYLNLKPTANMNSENEKNNKYEYAPKYRRNEYNKPIKPENMKDSFTERVKTEIKRYVNEKSNSRERKHPYITKVVQSMAQSNKLNQ